MADQKQVANHLEFIEFVVNHADEGIAVTDENGRFIYVNDAQCRNLGYSREKLLSMSVSDVDPSVTPENWPSIWEKIRAAGLSNFTFETEHRTRNGEFIPIELSIKYGVFNGEECCVAIVRNITARKHAEEELRKSEERLRLISESSAEIMYQLDLSGHIIYISPAVERVYGYTPDEILNLDHTPFFPESEYERVAEAINKTLKGENFQLLEFISKKKDNSFFPVEVSFTPTIKDGHIIGIQGVTRDITDRKQAEKALRDSEARWQFALEGAGDGIWDMNFATKKVYYSSHWKSMLGYSDEEIDHTTDVWEALLHPDDREAALAKVESYIHGETPIFQSEHRLRCKDGSYKWILARGKVVEWTEHGRPLRVIGTHTDISETKHLQKEHEQLIAELRDALDQVKQLSGILPICSSCKKIRDDKGYWQRLEAYIYEHSEAQFSHGLCPDCLKKLYPDYTDDEDNE